jgi:hypothetical protein
MLFYTFVLMRIKSNNKILLYLYLKYGQRNKLIIQDNYIGNHYKDES